MLLSIGALVKGSSSRLGTRLPFGEDLGLVSTSVTNLMFLCDCYPFYSEGYIALVTLYYVGTYQGLMDLLQRCCSYCMNVNIAGLLGIVLLHVNMWTAALSSMLVKVILQLWQLL